MAWRSSAASKTVFQKESGPPDQRCLSYTHDRDYGAFNAEYNADLVLRRWEPAVITPDAESASPVAASADQAPW